MSTGLSRQCCSSAVLFAVLAGCGDSGSASGSMTESGSDSATTAGPGGMTVASESTTGTVSATEAVPTEGSMSNSMSNSETTPTSMTGESSPTEATDTTTGGVTCTADELCGGECCQADELCDNGQCVPDCGGPPPCGEAKECCAPGDLCYLGECVTPAGACDESVCATKPLQNTCGPGFVCEPSQKLCLPSKADPTCVYIPPTNVFKPEPVFTWGRRTAFPCQNETQCQVAEECIDNVCTPTWKHITPGDDDMPNHYQSSSIPVVVDLDDNCVPDVVFNTYAGTTITANGVIRAVRGDSGDKLWTVDDPDFRTNSTANPAVADINGDGIPEILVAAPSTEKRIIAIAADGTPLWKSDPFIGVDSSGSVAVANMDNEGDSEIIFGAAIFDSSGKKLWEGNAGIGRNQQGPISCIADLDGDGRPELIGGRTAYKTTGTAEGGDFTGEILWNATPPDGFCGIADFDQDGQPEVVLVAQTNVYVLNGQTGAIRAQIGVPGGGRGGPPNIADFDGDGQRDIGVAGSSRYTVFRFNANTNVLSQLWNAVTEDDSSQVTGSSVFDFDGDGRYEVVYNDEAYIRIYPGTEPDCDMEPPGPGCNGVMTDAEVLFRDRNSSRTRTEYPVIADVNGDFKANIVFSTNNDSNASIKTDAGIEVFKDSLDNWVSTRPVWNQHTYHITNNIGMS